MALSGKDSKMRCSSCVLLGSTTQSEHVIARLFLGGRYDVVQCVTLTVSVTKLYVTPTVGAERW